MATEWSRHSSRDIGNAGAQLLNTTSFCLRPRLFVAAWFAAFGWRDKPLRAWEDAEISAC